MTMASFNFNRELNYKASFTEFEVGTFDEAFMYAGISCSNYTRNVGGSAVCFIKTRGASNCFKAAVVTAQHLFDDDKEFCHWSENALYAHSCIQSNQLHSLKKFERVFQQIQYEKNQDLIQKNNLLKEILETLYEDYQFKTNEELHDSDNAKKILLQNSALIDENDKLYRAIIDAARKKSLECNDIAIKAIILALSMNYVNSSNAVILEEIRSAFHPGQSKTVFTAKRSQVSELDSVYSYIEPEIDFPYLDEGLDPRRSSQLVKSKVTITWDNLTTLKDKVNRLSLSHTKYKIEHTTWLSVLKYLKGSVINLFNKVITVLKEAVKSSNPMERSLELAVNVERLVKDDPVTLKAKRLHRFNSRPSPLVHIICDNDLTDGEKEDLIAELAEATPYHFLHEKKEIRKNINLPGESVNSRNGNKDNPNGSPLHHAVKRGSSMMVRILLENGADVNAKATCSSGMNDINPLEVTALHMAVACGDLEKVKLLLFESKIDVNAVNAAGQTPLFAATSDEIVDLLVAHGANINHQAKNGQTPLHFAVLHGRASIVEKLINQKSLQVDLPDNLGNTALHVAAATSFSMPESQYGNTVSFSANEIAVKKKDNLQIISALIRKRANVNKANKKGYVPMHMAVLDGIGTLDYGYNNNPSKLNHIYSLDYQHVLEQVKLLCAAGADVNKKSAEFSFDRASATDHPTPACTPLLALYAHEDGGDLEKIVNKKLAQTRLQVAKYLHAKGANYRLEYQDTYATKGVKQEEGYTLLHQCARLADSEGFAFFVSLGLDPNYQASEKHDTPLHVFMDYHSQSSGWGEGRMLEVANSLLAHPINMDKTKLVKITVNKKAFDDPIFCLKYPIKKAIFHSDNAISSKAKQLQYEVNDENCDLVLKKVYQTIMNEKYRGSARDLVLEIPLTALEYAYCYSIGPSQKAAEFYYQQQIKSNNTHATLIQLG